MKLLRENMWIREWEWSSGVIVDSKFRTFDCNPLASDFIKRLTAADEAEINDMEKAFAYFPEHIESERLAILEWVTQRDPIRAQRMSKAWEDAKVLSPLEIEFQTELLTHAVDNSPTPLCVGNNRWFAVYKTVGGIHLSSKNAQKPPSEADFRALFSEAEESSNAAYWHGIFLARGILGGP